MKRPQKKKILVITPRIMGGPFKWGEDLVRGLNQKTEFSAGHIHAVNDKFLSPFKFGIDLIHTTNPLAFSFLMKPLILTVHGRIHGNFWRFFYWLARYRASAITVPSEYLKNELKLKKALVVPNAIDMDRFAPVNPKNRDFFNILTITKFWFPEKASGLFELAQIIFNLSKDFDKRINWRIVGGGPLFENIKKSVSLLERPKNLSVQWFGFDIPEKYFSDSDVFAYFSNEDNMPIAIMEAMASGLPVVTNKVGAVGEIITNGGDGFIAKDHQDYQNILLKLINDFNLRREAGASARKKILTQFSWETVLPKWIGLYNKLIK